MPTRCAECWLMDGLDGWCCAKRGRGLPTEYRYGIKDRPDWCPLVPVPPHGRLIDADEVKQEIIDLIDEYSWLDENGLHNPKWCAMNEAKMIIQESPTIIGAEGGEK